MRPSRRIIASACVVAILGMLPFARRATAHAILLESSPTANSTIAGPDLTIRLRFNVRIDAGRSRLTLVPQDGSLHVLEISTPTQPDTLLAQAKGLEPGEYRLRWQVLASDGHITRGEVLFRVTRA
jgi:copper resistance protein C